MDRPVYKITIEDAYADGQDLGIEMIAFTSKPAIKVKGMAFNSHVAPMTFSDDVKMRIVAPAMIPMNIYRFDEDTDEEYDAQFSAEVIEQIHAKFMMNLQNKDIFNLEHDAQEKVPAYILEAWIVDSPETDKAFTTYGIEVPKGTLMLTSQVTDKDYYDKLVESGQVGYSIEGFLGMKLSQHLNKYTMKLPDGEHMIEDKIYVVKDGEVIEIKDVPAPAEEEMSADVPVEEEAAAAEAEEEAVVEEEPVEMAIDPAMDAEAILAIVSPVIEEQVNQLVAMIADLKNQLEESLSAETAQEEAAPMAMSSHEKFKEFVKFSKTK